MAFTRNKMKGTVLTVTTQFSEGTKEILFNIIRYLCLFLFAYTAYSKTIDHTRFLHGLTKVHLISSYATLISFVVPTVEVIVSILLIIPKTVKAGMIFFIMIMSVFTVYIISAMIWEPKLPCHCGGAIEKLSWGQHIWFNLAFIFLASMGLWLLQNSNYLKKQVS